MAKIARVLILLSVVIFLQGCNAGNVIKDNANSEIASKEQVRRSSNDNKESEKEVKEENKKQEAIAQPNTAAPKKEASEETFYGQWIIKKQLAYGPVGTYSNEDIKNILGKRLSFSKEKASCFGEQLSSLGKVVEEPIYKKLSILKSDFEANNRIIFERLGIKGDSITEVMVTSLKDIECIFYVKDANTLILSGGGVYFELIRE